VAQFTHAEYQYTRYCQAGTNIQDIVKPAPIYKILSSRHLWTCMVSCNNIYMYTLSVITYTRTFLRVRMSWKWEKLAT